MHVYMYIYMYMYIHIHIHTTSDTTTTTTTTNNNNNNDNNHHHHNDTTNNTIGFHNFNLRIFNLIVSNPNKLIVDVLFGTMSDFNVPGSRPKKAR